MRRIITQINAAARAGNLRLLRQLVDKGADVNGVDLYDGFSPLHSASFAGRLEAVKFLLSSRASIDGQVSRSACADFGGSTALMLACLKGHEHVVSYLISAGASLSSSSLLSYAARSGRHDIVNMVLSAGATVNSVSLVPAVRLAKPDVVLALIAAGADVHHRNATGTPLINVACAALPRLKSSRAQLKIVELLLDGGADVNDRDLGGCTPLMEAVSCGKLSLVKLLIAKGADVNAKAAEGKTALHWAVEDSLVEIAKLLLNAGADPHAVWERKGSLPMRRGTPFEIARQRKDGKILRLFKAYK